MYRQANYLLYIILAASLALSMFSACTNDLKKIREISNKQVYSPADTTKGVDVIFSDSAVVKARMLTPLMLEFTVTKTNLQSYQYMPKGVKIIFYDKFHQESGNLVADTAYYYEAQRLIKLRKNVIVTSIKGDMFRSDELNWDMAYHKITSTKPVDVKMASGNTAHGTSMETNEKFDPLGLKDGTGFIYLDNKFGQ